MQWRWRREVMRPLFPWPEQCPERPAECCANVYQNIPIDIANGKNRYSKFPFFKRIITIPLRINIQIWNKYQTYNNKTWKRNTGKPWIKINQCLLQTQKIPRGFTRILGLPWIRQFPERSINHIRIKKQPNRNNNSSKELLCNQGGPCKNLIVFKFYESFFFLTHFHVSTPQKYLQ